MNLGNIFCGKKCKAQAEAESQRADALSDYMKKASFGGEGMTTTYALLGAGFVVAVIVIILVTRKRKK